MLRGRTIYHCHGSDRGKKYRTYGSRSKAKAAHRAMFIKRHLSK